MALGTGTLTMPRSKRNDLSVKIEASIQQKAKMIAGFRGIPIAEYLSDLLKGPVDRDYQKLVKEMASGAHTGKEHGS